MSFVFADHSPYMDGQLKPMQSPVLVREKQDSAGSTEQVVVDCVQAWTVTGLSLASMYSFCVQVPFGRQLFVSEGFAILEQTALYITASADTARTDKGAPANVTRKLMRRSNVFTGYLSHHVWFTALSIS